MSAWHNGNSRFRLEGGRAGLVRFQEGLTSFSLGWEMLVGASPIAVYAASLTATPPSRANLSDEQLRSIVSEFARDFGDPVSLIWHEGAVETIKPD